jgi:hypothetical protein
MSQEPAERTVASALQMRKFPLYPATFCAIPNYSMMACETPAAAGLMMPPVPAAVAVPAEVPPAGAVLQAVVQAAVRFLQPFRARVMTTA